MRSLFVLMLSCLIVNSYGQNLNKVIHRLLADDIPDGILIKNSIEDQLPLNNEFFERKQHMYVRWKGNLYLLLGGTGHVLKITKNSDTSYTYTKVDSTIFNGNNFGSFSFVADSILYNFGGYGHWRHNGQLRRFNQQTHEWDITVLNEEVAFKYWEPTSFAFTNFPTNKRLYITERVIGNQFVQSQNKENITKHPEIWTLDTKMDNGKSWVG